MATKTSVPASTSTPSRDVTGLVERLRSALARDKLVPGQRLVEADLCRDYGASRSTVRAALQELASDGLVEFQRNVGARVRTVDVQEAIEITEVRRALEGLSAAKAAERATDEEAQELREIGAEMRQAVENFELVKYSNLNATLHRRIREVARHSTVARQIDRLGVQIVRLQYRLALKPGRPKVSLEQHLAIIDAIAARDPNAAEVAMQAHVDSVLNALSDLDLGD